MWYLLCVLAMSLCLPSSSPYDKSISGHLCFLFGLHFSFWVFCLCIAQFCNPMSKTNPPLYQSTLLMLHYRSSRHNGAPNVTWNKAMRKRRKEHVYLWVNSFSAPEIRVESTEPLHFTHQNCCLFLMVNTLVQARSEEMINWNHASEVSPNFVSSRFGGKYPPFIDEHIEQTLTQKKMLMSPPSILT